MLTDNFYKNVLNVIADDANKMKDSFVSSIFHADTIDPKVQGRASLSHYFSVYLNAIQKWCEQNETASSFTPTTFLPENNPTIMSIINPDAVNLKHTPDDEDGE
jgi:hypothetical protein